MSAPRNTLSLPAALGRHAILLATAAFILTPFIWMVSLSIKSILRKGQVKNSGILLKVTLSVK